MLQTIIVATLLAPDLNHLFLLAFANGASLVEYFPPVFGWVRLAIRIDVLRHQQVRWISLAPHWNGSVAERADWHLHVFGAAMALVGKVLTAKDLLAASALHWQKVKTGTIGAGAVGTKVGQLHTSNVEAWALEAGSPRETGWCACTDVHTANDVVPGSTN